jgi:site-specific DNA-cytosine methylase
VGLYVAHTVATIQPLSFVLENVPQVLNAQHSKLLNQMLDRIKSVKDKAGLPKYLIMTRVLDTQQHGLPQSRKRVFIVGVQRSAMEHKFRWPTPVVLANTALHVLAKHRPPATPPTSSGCLLRLVKSLEVLKKKKVDTNAAVFVDIDSSSNRDVYYKKGICPCITSTRAATGGFWVTKYNARIGVKGLAALQGIDLTSVTTDMMSDRQLGSMIGNAWSINVASLIVRNLLIALGKVTSSEVVGPWSGQ